MKMKRISALLLMAVFFSSTTMRAQDENLVLHFDFSSVSGTSVKDVSASGVTAKLVGSAKVEQMGKYSVMSLGTASGYLDMTASAGKAIQGLTDYTVSVYYRIDPTVSIAGNGYFLWCFSNSAANTATESPYSGYRVNAQRFATSTGGYQNETGIQTGSASATGKWINVVYRQKSKKGQLYINGSLIGTTTNVPEYATIFTTAPAHNWIGRPPFSGDIYLTQTLVADFRVYNVSISDSELKALANVAEDLDNAYNFGTPGDNSALQLQVEDVERGLADLGSGYPQGAIDNVKDALSVAKTLIENGVATQPLLDDALVSLQKTYANLLAKKGFNMWAVSHYDVNEDHGFIHPGALHTQADFDRVKQQIADGNPQVLAGLAVLKVNEYSTSGIATWPVETIIRGGGSGQNYINAARGAAMAYQNALRWKIEGTEANAKAAVRILMAWANGCKYVSGDTNLSLAAGIYGYEFANAAELVRDYEGWSREDFQKFKKWMLRVWYPASIDFQRRRHDTWANSGGQGGIRPGHYWSNWGLCNTLFLMSLGVLCDDVHIYNQGLSFYKHDQVGDDGWSFIKGRYAHIWDAYQSDQIRVNTGLNEYIDNLVPIVHDDERGPYGKLGQMQESGRDQGHACMALGLAVDIAQVGWNQGDDLWAYHDNRLAAGIEFVAAYNFGGQTDLPWTEYRYADRATAWHATWNQTGIAGGSGEARPYWDRIVGHYEGEKGVTMQYSEMAAKVLRGTAGSDGGGHNYGENSGGYDHLGFTTLMCTRDKLDPSMAPYTLVPQIEYNGQVLNQAELGGLRNRWWAEDITDIPAGSMVTLRPQLPAGADESGTWEWNTGETTKDITVAASKSFLYRVTYTDSRGVKSRQVFSISVTGDCNPATDIYNETTYNGVVKSDTTVTAMFGESVLLYINGSGGYGYYRWDTGETGQSVIAVGNLAKDRVVTGQYMNQGGYVEERRFHIHVVSGKSLYAVNGGTEQEGNTVVVAEGSNVRLTLRVPTTLGGGRYVWTNAVGDTLDVSSASLAIDSIRTSQSFSVSYGQGSPVTFCIYVKEATDRLVDIGNYRIRHRATDTYLTNRGDSVSFEKANGALSQVWYIDRNKLARYNLCSLADSMLMKVDGAMYRLKTRPHRIAFAAGSDCCTFYNANGQYWYLDEGGSLVLGEKTVLDDYPFELVPHEVVTLEDITRLIDKYLDSDGEISLADITLLIDRYLMQIEN
ncbi:MAG: alginate lyase family protein [Bacteroidaceae bacterium]|nr:alginate lyase family protein [Bacteroidaceae bacterium]MBQ9642365.1 alginate lyase family protein [Bacteroidaceae bacterium]